MRSRRRDGGTAGLLALAVAATAPAATLQVPGQHATVGAALAAAAAGDTVVVAAGTYSPGTNGEVFPLEILRDVHLAGAGMGLSVLDADSTAAVFSLSAPSGVRVSGFTVTGGTADRGGGFSVAAGAPEISHNLVVANAAELRGAGLFGTNDAAPWIHHNVFWNNYDTIAGGQDPHAIVLAGTVGGVVEHNLIGRTDGNGLLTNVNAAPSVRHNLFLENGTTDPEVRGRGICWFSTVSPAVFHNLFWANQVAAILWPAGGSDLSAAQANAFSPTDSIFGNLDADPLLADPDHLDFALTSGSPAIDAGVPSYPPDPDGTIPDLGPFYFPQAGTSAPVGPEAGAILSLTGAPNPFVASTSVRFGLERAGRARVEVIDVRGRLVRALHEGRLAAGAHAFNWDGRDAGGARVASGVYLASVTVDGERRTAPVVLLR
jgi:hypothetical protein